MTCLRAGTSLNFSLIGLPITELAALERLKNPHRLDLIPFILTCNDNIHESLDRFEICLDLTTGFHGNR